MAIKRQAEEPGNALQHEDSLKYALPKTKKIKTESVTRNIESVPSVRFDLVKTMIVFVIIVGIIALAHFKLS